MTLGFARQSPFGHGQVEISDFFQGNPYDDGSFEGHYQQLIYSLEYERAQDAISVASADTPGLVTQTTDSLSSSSDSPSLEASEGGRTVAVLNLQESKKLDDSFTYPQLLKDTSPPPRSPHLKLAAVPAGSSHGHAGRRRQVHDREDTAQVREQGACLRCRIEKIKCSASGTCDKCIRLSKTHRYPVCIRTGLSTMGRSSSDVRDMWPCHEAIEAIVTEPRIFRKGRIPVFVSFTGDAMDSHMLRIMVEKYDVSHLAHPINPGMQRLTFPRECVPLHEELENWTEMQILSDPSLTFRHAIERLVMNYCRISQPRYPMGSARLPKTPLMRMVHKLNCMYRIWSHHGFYLRHSTSNEAYRLPPPIHSDLKNIARKAMRSIEIDILKELDACLLQKGPKKSERLPLWAAFWQIIHIYGDLLERTLPASGADPDQQLKCRLMTEEFLNAVVVSYAGLFRSKVHIEDATTLDPRLLSSQDHSDLQQYIDFASKCRQDFYQLVQRSDGDFDMLLRFLIVDHEMKKLKARRRGKQSSMSASVMRRSVDRMDIDDEEDDGEDDD